MERTPFRDIKNRLLNIREPTRGELAAGKAGPGDVVLCNAGPHGKIVCIISTEHLFDANGNRFAY